MASHITYPSQTLPKPYNILIPTLPTAVYLSKLECRPPSDGGEAEVDEGLDGRPQAEPVGLQTKSEAWSGGG